MSESLYEILGVLPTSSKGEIKAAYKKLVRKFHPDINHEKSAEIIFKKINSAAEILLDDVKKLQYDVSIGVGIQKTKQKTVFKEKEFKKQAEKIKNEKNNNAFSKIVQEIFANKKPKAKTASKKNGENINMTLNITVKEALMGTERKINIVHSEKCAKCGGREFINGARCTLCDGEGESVVRKKINIKIPPGIKNYAKIRLKGEGNQGINGGKNGDLYLTVNIADKEKQNLTEVFITPWEAVFGTSLDIPLQNGFARLKIPAGTNSGQKFKIVNKNSKEAEKEMTIFVTIKIPKNMTSEEKLLYQRLEGINRERKREELF